MRRWPGFRSARPPPLVPRTSLGCCDLVPRRHFLATSEQQRIRLLAAPGLQPTLKGSKKLVRIGSRIFHLQAREQFATSPPRLSFKPFSQIWRCSDERGGTTSASFRLHEWPIRRSHGSVLPGRAQACQEAIDRLRCHSRMADWLGISEGREALLHVADVAQQRDWIESGIDFLEVMADSVRRAGVRRQALVWCSRRAVCLRYTGTVALLGYQFERGLEEVHEQPRRSIEFSQQLGRFQALEPTIADYPAHDGAVLLLDERLVIFSVGPATREDDVGRLE
ncbi:hypothetical protein ACVWXP_003467 [Bradyrhizobium sp. USDA 4463]